MEEIEIYQVFEYVNDEHSPSSKEHGYFKSIDNAIQKVKEVIYSEDKFHVKINQEDLFESGLYIYHVDNDDKHAIGIWKVELND